VIDTNDWPFSLFLDLTGQPISARVVAHMHADLLASHPEMAVLHVRGVPDDLYRALARRARERDTSITAEAIRLLRRALSIERPGQAKLIEAIRAEREPVRPGARSAVDLIREDRSR
jgi:plasmid stability protein